MTFEGNTPSPKEIGVNQKANSQTGLENLQVAQELVGMPDEERKDVLVQPKADVMRSGMESLISVDIFPDKVRGLIQEEIRKGKEVGVGFQTLKREVIVKKDKIQAVLEEEIDETDPFAGMFKGIALSQFFDKLKQLEIPYYDLDLHCRELMELRAELLEARAECRGLLGESTDSLAPDHLEASISRLQERIIEEENYINGENLASHVTGYSALVRILQSGSLTARKVQGQSREVVSTFQEKGRSEEHQIVFDMRTIRSSYARGKDKKGREDPIIIMMRSRDLMTQYQYLDSDGRHFFGKKHDPNEDIIDPFQSNVDAQNTVILVPETYRDDLISDLTETARNSGIPIEQYLEGKGVVFITSEEYKVRNGDFAGKIFSGIQSNGEIGENDRNVVDGLLEIGKKKLYSGELPKIAGRQVPTGNICEGAGGVMSKAYIFTTLEEKQ